MPPSASLRATATPPARTTDATEGFDDRTPWSSSARQPLAIAGIALLACAAYYAGSLIGLQLRLPGGTTSILWPPNAILTAVLLLTPPRRWVLVLACVLPVHVLIQLPTGWPMPLIGLLFLTNCSEAVIAAGGLSLLSETPWRFDTVRRLMAFFAAVVIAAPVLSSFGDAAAVAWFRGEPYWHVWRMRTMGNILAELIIVPGIVGGVLLASRITRAWSPARAIEAAALALALGGVGWLEFSGPTSESIDAVSSRMPIVLQLPLILWAAVRFGAAGAGLTLLFTSLFAAWSVVHGVGPFATLAPSATVPALTLSLIIVSATLMWLATLTEERRHTQHALAVRLQFEGLLSQLSRALLELPSDQLHVAFEAWLGRIGLLIGVDALTLFVVRHGEPLACEYTWTAPDLGHSREALLDQQARWARQALESRPVSSQAAGGALATGGALPLVGHGEVLGALAYGSARDDTAVDLPPNAWLLAEVLASALNRKRADTELRRAEIDAQRTRQELAHVGRVSTVGEMTASLAHQLNQPLTAIMTNAHAARRIMMKDNGAEPESVRAILADIVSDARRASDVIQHLRDFLRKGDLEMTRLNVSRVVRDVVALARSEAIIRQIDVSVDCPGAHYVRADRVQIQQVVLNLLHNAMDAVEQADEGTRRIVIACRGTSGQALCVSIHDSGPGLEPGTEEMVFDPFYTTKRGGMGMGLSIVRTIVEAHGGSVRAANAPGRGAVFEVTLPCRAGAEEDMRSIS
jgi:two-component system, LuxR family, sensor kinase FixL